MGEDLEKGTKNFPNLQAIMTLLAHFPLKISKINNRDINSAAVSPLAFLPKCTRRNTSEMALLITKPESGTHCSKHFDSRNTRRAEMTNWSLTLRARIYAHSVTYAVA